MTIEGYEKLKIDRVLFESTYPIIYTMADDKGSLYFCVCCQNDRNGKRTMVSKTDAAMILSFLVNEVTLRDMVIGNPAARLSVFEKDGNISIEEDESLWAENSRYLPQPGEYLDAEKGEFAEEIDYYMEKASTEMQYFHKDMSSLESRQRYFGLMLDPETKPSERDFIQKEYNLMIRINAKQLGEKQFILD